MQPNPNSKRSQLKEIYRRRYGNTLQPPNARQLKNWEAHKATENHEYLGIKDFVGMYAGYFVFTEIDRHTNNLVYLAAKLHYDIYTYQHNGEIRSIAGRSRWVFAQSEQGIIESILYQMVDNSGYRGKGTKKIEKRNLPKHLRPYV